MKIAVVGLGLAGLQCARLLEGAGVEVTRFEARHRLGGRLLTVHGEDGPLYEAGAEWIDEDHRRVHALLESLGLSARAKPSAPGELILLGERTRDDDVFSDGLDSELAVDMRAAELARSLADPAWLDPRAPELEEKSAADFIAEHAASERGRRYVESKYKSDEGDELSRVGLLGWLVGFQLYMDRSGGEMCAHHLPLPASELAERLSALSHGPVILGARLSAVTQRDGRVTLAFADGRRALFDRAVLALPPPALESIAFDPPLPREQDAAVRALGFGRGVKLCFEFSAPFWRDRGLSGNLRSDGPITETWDASLGARPVLCAYIVGDAAARFAESGPRAVEEGLSSLAEYYPEARSAFLRGTMHDWIGDPFARGVHSHFPPGYILGHRRNLAQIFGCVHFAGEHTAVWSGFMEGALESGERAAAECLQLIAAHRGSAAPGSG